MHLDGVFTVGMPHSHHVPDVAIIIPCTVKVMDSLARPWSLQLHLSVSPVVIKECAHKCSIYFDPISIIVSEKKALVN